MLVIRESQYSGVVNVLELPITQEQLDKYNSGKYLIQDVFPHLSKDEREFMTGITAEEWNDMFGEEL